MRVLSFGVSPIVLAGAFAATSVQPLAAQRSSAPPTTLAPVVVPDAPSCATCSITIGPARTLAFPAGMELANMHNVVREDARGRVWVIESETGRIRLFDRDGRYMRSVGREGAGPGEFRSPSEVLSIPGDSVVILDAVSARATVLTPDLRYARSMLYPLQLGFASIMRWPDSVLVPGRIQGEKATGWPLHVLSFRASAAWITHSFGSGPRLAHRELFYNQHTAVASSTGGAVSVPIRTYDLYTWSSTGRMTGHFVRRPSWFPGSDKLGLGNPTTPPYPQVHALRTDASGLIWVAIGVPSSHWKAGWDGVTIRAGEFKSNDPAFHELFDTIIEVIDPKSGRVLARQKVEGWITQFLRDGRMVRYTATRDDEPQLQLLSATLVRR